MCRAMVILSNVEVENHFTKWFLKVLSPLNPLKVTIDAPLGRSRDSLSAPIAVKEPIYQYNCNEEFPVQVQHMPRVP